MTSRKAYIEIAAKDNASYALARITAENQRLNKQLRSITAANDSFNRSMNQSRGMMRGSRGALGQMSYQIQDVAVQLQGGQNAMLVFTQQGSQMASVFGPTGIVVGAILAVGGALGTALLPNLFKTTDSMEELERVSKLLDDTFDDLDGRTRILTDRMKELYETNKKAFEVELLASYKNASDGAAVAITALSDTVEESSGGAIQDIVEIYKAMDNDTPELLARNMTYYSKQLGKAQAEAREELGITEGQALQLADKFRLLQEGKITPVSFQSTLDDMVDMNLTTAQFAKEIRGSTDAWGDHQAAIDEIQALLDGLKAPEFKPEKETGGSKKKEFTGYTSYEAEREAAAIREMIAKEQEQAELARVERVRMAYAALAQEKIDADQKAFEQQNVISAYEQYYAVMRIAAMDAEKQKREELIESLKEYSMVAMQTAATVTGLFAQLASNKQSSLAEEVRNAKNMSNEEIAQREKAAKEAFEAEKKWAIAGVAMNTGVAAMKALATEDPFTKWASFAAVLATGATQAAAIEGRTFNSGAFKPSGGGVQPIQNTTNNQSINNNVTITGGVGFGIAELQELFDNDNVIIQPNSAQARALMNG